MESLAPSDSRFWKAVKSKPQHNLIAIANPELASRLEKQQKRASTPVSGPDTLSDAAIVESNRLDSLVLAHDEVKRQSWRALLVLNLLRYFLAVWVLADMALGSTLGPFELGLTTTSPPLFLACTLILLSSAVLFTYLSKVKSIPLTVVLISQLLLDLLIAVTVTHISGKNSNEFFFIFFVIVTTGSVVLTRRNALGLASSATLLILGEHVHTLLEADSHNIIPTTMVAGNAIVLMVSALVVSSFARMLNKQQLSRFVPGTESLESFLLREEINAIKAALKQTDGNKTQAAAMLGLTFRSFRYKIDKYGIE